MTDRSNPSTETIVTSIALARAHKPAYEELYPMLEKLFLAQAQTRKTLHVKPPALDPDLVQARWKEGFPLLRRWDFPIDAGSADEVRIHFNECIPTSNTQLRGAFTALTMSLRNHPGREKEIWRSFLQHEWEPWEEWVDTREIDVASLLFLARSCIRPSVEWTAEDILRRFSRPQTWLRGYCPICGSLPALLMLQDRGERMGFCSWCSTTWGLHRMQCPYCDNRLHESLGYLYAETEPQYRVDYCRLCKNYFKLIDARELIAAPYLPLEEWTTLHLDLLAQDNGWRQPPSPSPVVYGAGSDVRGR